MLKKIMLLGAAIAALVAIAAPAAQAEVQWETDGVPITAHDTVAYHGNAHFNLVEQVTGTEATVEATLTLFNGTHKVGDTVAEVYEFHVSNCKGLGALAGTTCTPTTTTQSWPIVLTAKNTLEIGVNLHQLYWAGPHTGAPVATTLLTGGVDADINPNDLSTITLTTGEELTANGNPAQVTGELHKTGTNKLAIT